MSAKLPICLEINGSTYRIEIEPRTTLADAIRQECGLTGTHVGCEHGICGACTVIVDGEAVRSCLMFAVQAEGCKIRTVEGLAAVCPNSSCPAEAGHPRLRGTAKVVDGRPSPTMTGNTGLHPLQAAFMQHHGLQCGFCTPGFLMLAAAVLERDPDMSDAALTDALAANLCRCTGYQGIIDAVLAAARVMRTEAER